jgi:cytochrome c oxidase cbb3-type subunit 1
MIVCTTGVLLATLLLVPSLGRLFEPFSYGRWVTVHLNSALYGWSSVPLIGLLFLVYLPHQKKSPVADTAVIVWSSVLLFALIGWLSGHTSGKLFMEWSGASRWAILCGMAFLATALWIAYIQRLKEQPESRPIKILKVLSLISLSVIPFVMYLAADPSLYPPINPDSGGATGGSLLGSTLGIVVIYWITPFVLGLKVGTSVPLVRSFLPSFILLLLHFAAFSLLDHGDRSHHEIGQIVALASLVVWVPLLVRHMNRFVWPASSRRWLIAFAGWGGVLTLNGLFTFMPHVLDHWKFTNALVAHVHIAMAGMITSFNILILVVLNQSSPLGRAFSSRGSFWAWQLGTVVHAVALLAAGTLEALHPAWLFTGHPAMNVLYGVRLAAGLVMLTAAWFWFGLVHKNQGVA